MPDTSYVKVRHPGAVKLWTDRKPLLTELDIELTERCNNDCLHCCINLPAGDVAAMSGELTTTEVERILNEAAGLGCLQVRFTGGEPLLREDFETIYLHARRLGIRVMLFTNARRITPSLADLFVRVPPSIPIEITVYGMHPESYDAAARAPGGYAEFRRGVELLLERRVPFIVKGADLPPNRHEKEEFEEWAASIPWMRKPPSVSQFFQLRTREGNPLRNRLIAGLRAKPETAIPQTQNREKYIRDMQAFSARCLGPPGDRLFRCGITNKPSVDAYGWLQPCLSMRMPMLKYNLREGTPRDALVNGFPKILTMRATNPEYLCRCARCFLKSLCEQCPANSWLETGTLDTPVEYLCAVAHTQARDLGLLRDGEKSWEVTDWKERVQRFTQINPATLAAAPQPTSVQEKPHVHAD